MSSDFLHFLRYRPPALVDLSAHMVRSSARSVKLSVKLRHDAGNFLSDCIWSGAGERALSEWHSQVFYHNNSPRFGMRESFFRLLLFFSLCN
jgi:hypothetical protein